MYFLFAEANPLVEAFTTNVANWILLVILLVILWMKMAPPMFKTREESVNRAIGEANKAREDGQKFLQEQSARIANAEKEAEQILEEARKIAATMQADIREQTKKETAEIARKIEQSVDAQRNMAITQLRSQAATAAVRLAEASLPGAITDSAKKRLLTQFVEQLDTVKTGTNGRN